MDYSQIFNNNPFSPFIDEEMSSYFSKDFNIGISSTYVTDIFSKMVEPSVSNVVIPSTSNVQVPSNIVYSSIGKVENIQETLGKNIIKKSRSFVGLFSQLSHVRDKSLQPSNNSVDISVNGTVSISNNDVISNIQQNITLSQESDLQVKYIDKGKGKVDNNNYIFPLFDWDGNYDTWHVGI